MIRTCASRNGFRSVCLLGSDFFTLGADVSTLVVGAIASGKRTLGDFAAAAGLCTLGVSVVADMLDLHFFFAVSNFGGGTVNVGFMVAGLRWHCVQLGSFCPPL